MYILVNSDLKMSSGKISAQVGHAVEMLTELMVLNYKINPKSKLSKIIINYRKNGRKKIVLKASQKDLEEFKKINNTVYVIDAGKTEILSGSLTAVAHFPVADNQKSIFKDFKLL